MQVRRSELSFASLPARVSPCCVQTGSRGEELDILDPLALFCSVDAQSTSIVQGRQK